MAAEVLISELVSVPLAMFAAVIPADPDRFALSRFPLMTVAAAFRSPLMSETRNSSPFAQSVPPFGFVTLLKVVMDQLVSAPTSSPAPEIWRLMAPMKNGSSAPVWENCCAMVLPLPVVYALMSELTSPLPNVKGNTRALAPDAAKTGLLVAGCRSCTGPVIFDP